MPGLSVTKPPEGEIGKENSGSELIHKGFTSGLETVRSEVKGSESTYCWSVAARICFLYAQHKHCENEEKYYLVTILIGYCGLNFKATVIKIKNAAKNNCNYSE